MRNVVSKAIVSAVLLVALASVTPRSMAQSTNKTVVEKKATNEQKDGAAHKSAHPYHGKLAAIDKTAKTITVGKSVYQITSETKIKKGDKPAILEDGVIGEPVSGYAKPMDGGKMFASSVNFGPKPESAGAKKSQKK